MCITIIVIGILWMISGLVISHKNYKSEIIKMAAWNMEKFFEYGYSEKTITLYENIYSYEKDVLKILVKSGFLENVFVRRKNHNFKYRAEYTRFAKDFAKIYKSCANKDILLDVVEKLLRLEQ